MQMFQTPSTGEEWKAVADQFYSRWNFPNCIGAIDGKHVEIVPPKESGSYYFNYKGTHSIVLLAVSNANYEFIYVDVGANGRISDGGVWNNSKLREAIESEDIGIPPPQLLPNSTRSLPFVLVGDDAFGLKPYLMKPYPFRSQSPAQSIFSYRLSRARRVIENAFGIMSSRFRVLKTPIAVCPEKVEKIVLACAVLHILLRKEAHEEYLTPGMLDAEDEREGQVNPGSWRSETPMLPVQLAQPARYSTESKQIREQFNEYFQNEGVVSWQYRMVNL